MSLHDRRVRDSLVWGGDEGRSGFGKGRLQSMKTTSTYPSIERLAETLTLRSASARTIEEYTRQIRKLAERLGHSPVTLGEHEVRAYILHVRRGIGVER